MSSHTVHSRVTELVETTTDVLSMICVMGLASHGCSEVPTLYHVQSLVQQIVTCFTDLALELGRWLRSCDFRNTMDHVII